MRYCQTEEAGEICFSQCSIARAFRIGEGDEWERKPQRCLIIVGRLPSIAEMTRIERGPPPLLGATRGETSSGMLEGPA
jgi:hypothetical protein